MSDKLIVYNYLHKPLAILNDDSDDRAKGIEEDIKIDGVSTLKFEIPLKSSKWHYVVSDNIVVYKGQMYIVQIPNISKSTSSSIITVECHHIGSNLEGKLNEAYGDTDLIGKTIREMCDVILVGSGWTLGDVDVPDTMKRALVVKEQSIMSNIKKIGELFDCTFIFDATLDYKKIHFRRSATDNLMVIREGVNMNSLSVNLDKSGLITRLLVYGGNDAITNRPITVYGATIKDRDGNIVLDELGQPKIYDKTYIEDYSFYLNMGYEQSYIDAHPEYFLKESILNLSDYISKDDLLMDSMRTLRELAQPRIDVTFDMADKIDNDNLFLHTPVLNEMVYVYSKEINDKLNIKTTVGYNGKMFQLKVNNIKTNSDKPESCSVTTKNYSQFGGIVQTLISNAETINRLVQSDGTISTNKLQGFIDVLQTKLNSTQSHWFTDVYGNLVFENSQSTEAMKLGGGVFGIANSRLPDGSWNWRTFGSGAGFTADMMTTGTMNADLIKTGILTSYDGSVVIDLDTGYFNFKDKIVYDIYGVKIIGAVSLESLDNTFSDDYAIINGWKVLGKTTINGGKIETDSITALQIKTGEINAKHIATDSITSTMIQAGEIKAVNIAADSITSPMIQAGEIKAVNIATDAITSEKIMAGEIKAVNIATDSITSDKIMAGEINATHIAVEGISAGSVKTGVLKSTNDVSNINLDTGTFSFGDGKIAYDGTNVSINADSLKIASSNVASQADISQSATDLTLKFGNVGSSNLLPTNSGFTDGLNGWTVEGTNIFVDASTSVPSGKCVRIEGAIGVTKRIYENFNSGFNPSAKKWTLSAFLRNNHATIGTTNPFVDMQITIFYSDGTWEYAKLNDNITTIFYWKKAVKTFTTNLIKTVSSFRVEIYARDVSGGSFYVSSIMIEEGEVAHTWSNGDNEVYSSTFKMNPIGFEMKDSNGSVLIETAKGIANEQNFGSTQNVEDGYPLNMSFKIGDTTSIITKVELRMKMYNFRTDSKGSAASASVSSGASTRSTSEAGASDNYTSATQVELSYPNEGKHYHVIKYIDSAHSHGMTHTHTIASHTHVVDFGILETPNTNNYIYVDVDGVQRNASNSPDITIDITSWITTNGIHNISLRSPNMKRIQADLFIKSYIRR